MKRREFIAGLGSAATWPGAARAQQPAMPVIGFLSIGAESTSRRQIAAFHRGLGEQGYMEGRNIAILYRWAEFRIDQLPHMAADLVARNVAVIITTAGTAPALAAKAATTTIPILFQLGADPVRVGLVASLSRPGGNITGATFLTAPLVAKRLELLHEAVPAATRIAYLTNPNSPDAGQPSYSDAAALSLGVSLLRLNATNASEIEAAFAAIAGQQMGALLVDSDVLFFSQRDQLARLAAHYSIPAIYHHSELVEAGGLMSYGGDGNDAWRLAGVYAGRIIKGEKPTDLPVQQSTAIKLTINLKTAKSLGITFPITLLGRADEVIE